MPVLNENVTTSLYQLSEYENAGLGNWAVSTFASGSRTWWQDTRTKNKNPLWRDQLKKGADASSYYKRTGTSVSILPLRGTSRSFNTVVYPYNTKGVFSDALLSSWVTKQPTDSTVRDIALARVKRRVASLEESYQALIPLAEIREARGLFRQMLDMTIDMVKVIADLKRTKGKSVFRYAQDRWLIYSFGISPMIADLQGLASSIWAYLTKGDVRDRVQGTHGKDWLTSAKGDSFTGMLGAPIRFDAEMHHYLSYRYVAGWKFLIRSSTDYGMLSHLGIKPSALIPALWETTAYSWVVDYFTTAGDWLEDMFTGSSGSSMYVVEDRKYLVRGRAELQYYLSVGASARILQQRPGMVDVEYFEFERTPLSALPQRTLRFRTLDEIGAHSLTKLLNLASLTFRGRKWSDI